ncbi:hypothetical protein PV10_06134 [Exophiala mesophila]|uniref:NAD-dependent epimerase/dehydratase domain-containing protein n=1 Tax=Exophiala mesophila TaxID=212818 RepID=A0A0D1XTW6_EXOME|nr:uncharacterized protein PV10_06134 [Exophiala mesophila]KIV91616.1 hypothetical protein PV10_06134 [Exophiala mesophila]
MPPKVFITGVTGYIGGDFLHLVSEKKPEWEITALVRNSDKGAKVVAVYPKVRLVYGDLDAVDVIEDTAANNDIIYHFANCDHEASAVAIAKGLGRRDRPGSGFWIHTSGTMILAHETISKAEWGNRHDKVYNDWDNVAELTSQPDHAAHRNVDKIVLAAGSNKVKTAIVCPPTIYGPGRGPDNQRSVQIYGAAEGFLKHQKAFKIGKGENVWHYIHVHDLSNLYLLLGEAAANGGPPATWNDQGYYLAENGSFVWGEVLQAIAKIAYKKKLLPSDELESYGGNEAEKSFWQYATGTDSQGVSIRGKRLLGWSPSKRSIQEELSDAVDSEARRLGLIKSHAQTVEEE